MGKAGRRVINLSCCRCGLRLSVADPPNLCMFCADAALKGEPMGLLGERPNHLPCSRCGAKRRVKDVPYCKKCRNDVARQSARRVRERELLAIADMGFGA